MLGDKASDTSKMTMFEQQSSIDTTKGANKPNMPPPPVPPVQYSLVVLFSI